MEPSAIRIRLTPQQVCDQMSDFKPVTEFTGSWQELLRMLGPTGHIGEIREEGDWDNVPREQHLRAVCVTDAASQVIRWGDNRMHEVLGGERPTSDLFIRRGESGLTVRKGYIYITHDGEIRIQGESAQGEDARS
jgi:hypothetical protein